MSYNNKSPWGNKQQGANPMGSMGGLNHSGMVPFQPQQQVFQNLGLNQQNLGLGLQQMAANQLSLASNPIFQQQLSAVSYPNTRGLNPTAFQTQTNVQQSSNAGTKQKVFTGTVTQIHENFGFIDEEVFFSRNVCIKGSNPVVGDRVLVEATFNSSMPFKWNAARVQVMPSSHPRDPRHSQVDSNNGFGRRDSGNRDFGNRDRAKPSAGERRNRSRDRDDDEVDRKRRREDRQREREKEEKDRKSPVVRRRSRSPKPRNSWRSRAIPRYMVQIPKLSLSLSHADVLDVKKRYNTLYIPSDFFYTSMSWVNAFPADKPYALDKPCSFHIMNKELDSITNNDAVLEPADADYRFSAKVMLMSVPGMEEIYQKCCHLSEEKESRDRDSEEKDNIHPTRLINFLVGLRGKNETMAIGGPWSPSLDGENPEQDPSVLIKTAIRSCKALTGIDLSNCTQWYRFVELYYRRSATTHKGKAVPARVETVVIFLPDVWSCLPTRLEWEELQQGYRKHVENILKAADGVTEETDNTINISDEKNDEVIEKLEPTVLTELNVKSMTVAELRAGLQARDLDSKGLKAQLVARLTKALKSEAEMEEECNEEESSEKDALEKQETVDKEEAQSEKEKKPEPEEKKLDEVQKRRLEKQYTLPDQPHLIIHPSKTAKSGKFDCTSMSLSLLLDYRLEDTKEHTFEVSLFAELFNEMLMRDFGFNIFKALIELPEKPKEDEKKKKDEKKDDKKKDGDEETKMEESEPKKDDDKKKDRDERKSESTDDEDTSSRKSKDKKKKDRVKLITKDKHLLLSFVYFDQTHCGYIFDKDIEELFYTLGLSLSRSQIKKILNKAVARDNLYYRKLTDKPKEEEKAENEVAVEKPAATEINLNELALGNRKFLPIFNSQTKTEQSVSDPNDGLVVYRGAVVDVGKLLIQLDRSEKARIETEQYLVDLKNENQKLTDKYSKSSSTIKHLNSEVKEFKDKLRTCEDALGRSNAHTKLFQTALLDIRDRIEPVLKSASHKEEKKERDRDDKKKDRDDGKSRWEKERDSRKDDIKKDHEIKKEIRKEKKEDEVDKKDTITEVEEVQMKEEKN
ncbi:unnamed protein product [Ceutorhynchus assimilis]|uniref:SAP domain-containing protein n=1 Tax=Ceutorhynchus assimilis TaxID=467358 RepID=A0A9N9QKM9_9CUCU|nr:unnamed protein product [Ceutorhynchus assimilis]